jgi:Bifunctional DNA primase/polymerase, N-terminal
VTETRHPVHLEVLDAARGYVERGWWVLLVDADSKRPLPGYGPHTATRDLERIGAGLETRPDAGLAVAAAPSGLCVLDVDRRHGGDLAALEHAGELPATWTVRTPGGVHMYFQHPGVETRGKLDETRFPGVDVRDDAYVITPPTRRSDGSTYTLECDDDPAPLGWLAELVAAPTRAQVHGNGQGVGPWEEAHAWTEILEPAGWVHVFSRDSQEFWRRPGKDDGWSAATNRTGTDTLKVWSTAADLPTDGTLTKFYVFAQLHHGGDLSAAGRAKAAWLKEHAAAWVRSIASDAAVDEEPNRPIRDPALALPDEFWTARPELEHIRQAAHSRGVSAEAVLGVVLGRVAAASPHTVEIPDHVGVPCGLSMIVTVVGPPGTSKSAAVRIATDLVPPGLIDPKVDGIGPGSGEGLIDALFELVLEPDPRDPDHKIKVRRQVRFNAFLYGDEAEAVIRQAGRSSGGSTFLTHLRSIFTSGQVGQTNVGDNFRNLPAGSYVYTVVLGVQPTRARALFDDHGGGTPQRFLWCPAMTPIPELDDWPEQPGPLNWTSPTAALLENHKILRANQFRHEIDIDPAIVREIRENHARRQAHGCNSLDEHRDLIRLKDASTFALLNGPRLNIDLEDWALATMVMDVSDATRATVLAELDAEDAEVEHARRERDAGRKIHIDDATEKHRIVECAKRIARKVEDHPQAPAELYRALRVWRDVFDDALSYAAEQHWIEVVTEPGQGTDKRTVHPGRRRPT